jgi:cellulose synthase/poly-beta-1,6-N-acetylglucosamine synthase-like glycosyltransferase
MTIRLLLDAVYQQTYPRANMEVVIADGSSTDRTLEQIRNFQAEHPDLLVRVVGNEKRTIPAGLNRAIQAANGNYIVRLDAHSMPHRDYLAQSVIDLEQNLGDNVGGVWEIQPGDKGWLSKGIALAASHPLGVGDARYRYTDQAGSVDTVPFGAFRRSLIEKIGFFDEELLTNEDYEFNTRVRQAGGTVWLDPAIRSVYFARSTLPALARQYWRYGYWKVRMLRKYPATIRWRQAIPPLFVASLVILAILSIWLPIAPWLIILELALYLFALGLVGIRLAIKHADFKLVFGVPLAIMTMHLSWGSAFLWSMVS